MNNKTSKGYFTGWKEVFSFTMHTQTDTKAFRLSTLLFAVGVFAIAFLSVYFMGKNGITSGDGTETKPVLPGSEVSVLYVLDESGLEPADVSSLAADGIIACGIGIVTPDYEGVVPDNISETANAVCSNDTTAVLLHILSTDEGYTLDFVLPSYSHLDKGDISSLTDTLTNYYYQYKLVLSGYSAEELSKLTAPVTTQISVIGVQEKSVFEVILNMLAPMLLALAFYMMILLYGQTICKSLVTEKTSKLLETLLTSVRPAAIVTGKVLAMTTIALVQFILWIASGVLGAVAANSVNASNIPGYVNPISSVIQMIRESSGEFAFSLPSMILALVILVVGFLFYCTLAGLAGAMINKMEEIGSGMMLFQIPVIFSFLLAYMPRAFESGEGLKLLARFLPISAPFALPAELIIGDAPISHGLISLAILILSFLLLLYVTGKIYKGLIMISGSKFGFKTFMQLIRSK